MINNCIWKIKNSGYYAGHDGIRSYVRYGKSSVMVGQLNDLWKTQIRQVVFFYIFENPEFSKVYLSVNYIHAPSLKK